MSGTATRTDSEQSRVAAIYARVSSERQRQEQTIASQTAALRELAEQRGLVVPDEFVFEDDGFSGANLQRPALEQLRDRAFDGCFEVVLCHAPDRLARRYAYQVLLLEELARGGIEVVFAKEPERSGSPEDELLRQFQGMIAEYERAQIAERCRRGKLHRARAGAVSVLSGAPYGYRYVKRTEHADAFYEIDELEAPIVREIFDRYVERRESIVQIGRALSEQGVPTRTGTPHWGSSTIWAILRNPAYIGQAAYGRRRVTGEPAKPMRLTRQRGRHSGRSAYEHVGPEHWLRIPVPALISEEQHALAQELLERNSRLSPRNTRKPSLLQGILVCRECGHSYYRSSTRSKTGNVHHYYRCSGADSFRRPEGRVCAARPVRIDEVDEPVWAQVLALLENPELIKTEIDRRLQALRSRAPRHPPPRRAPTRPDPCAECAAQTDRRLPGTADHARGTPRPHARAASARGDVARRAGRARHRAARRRDLSQADRDARRVPRPPLRQRRESHGRAAPRDRAARRARGPARRRRHHRSPLNPGPHERPARRFATAFAASRRCAGRSRTCSASRRWCIGAPSQGDEMSLTCSPSATGRGPGQDPRGVDAETTRTWRRSGSSDSRPSSTYLARRRRLAPGGDGGDADADAARDHRELKPRRCARPTRASR